MRRGFQHEDMKGTKAEKVRIALIAIGLVVQEGKTKKRILGG